MNTFHRRFKTSTSFDHRTLEPFLGSSRLSVLGEIQNLSNSHQRSWPIIGKRAKSAAQQAPIARSCQVCQATKSAIIVSPPVGPLASLTSTAPTLPLAALMAVPTPASPSILNTTKCYHHCFTNLFMSVTSCCRLPAISCLPRCRALSPTIWCTTLPHTTQLQCTEPHKRPPPPCTIQSSTKMP